jgi:hypothetical protein
MKGRAGMERRIPKPGEIYNHFKGNPYQIITVAIHSETQEPMVVYQALYEDFKTYVRPLEMFLSEVDHMKYPVVKQKYRFELRNTNSIEFVLKPTEEASEQNKMLKEDIVIHAVENTADRFSARITEHSTEQEVISEQIVTPEGSVNAILLKFLDAGSYSKKLEVITSNRKHLNDRLINDMAVSLDCAVDEGPLDQRIQGLIYCLQAMCRFEDKRLR